MVWWVGSLLGIYRPLLLWDQTVRCEKSCEKSFKNNDTFGSCVFKASPFGKLLRSSMKMVKCCHLAKHTCFSPVFSVLPN